MSIEKTTVLFRAFASLQSVCDFINNRVKGLAAASGSSQSSKRDGYGRRRLVAWRDRFVFKRIGLLNADGHCFQEGLVEPGRHTNSASARLTMRLSRT